MNKQRLKELFETYYKEIFNESPYDVGSIPTSWISSLGINEKTTQDIIKECDKVDSGVKIQNSVFDVYGSREDETIQNFFVEDNYTSVRFNFKWVGKGI